jgi:DNA-binding transcriptional LysR family regulator
MDLRELRYFRAVAEFGTLSKAAVHLRVAQPALSRHMTNLERELGVSLLNRTTKGVTLTEAGRILLERSKKLSEDLEDARREVSGMADHITGNLRVLIQAPLSTLLARTVLKPYHLKYPDVALQVRESGSDEMTDGLLQRKVDVAIYDAPEHPHADLRSFPLWTEAIRLVAPLPAANMPAFKAGHATIRELAKLPIIIPGRHSSVRRLVDEAFNREGLRLVPAIEAGSERLLIELVKAGLGYAPMPIQRFGAPLPEENIRIIDVRPAILRTMRVVTRSTLVTARTVAPFLSLVRASAQRLVADKRSGLAMPPTGTRRTRKRKRGDIA